MTVCGSHCLEANIFIKTVPLLILAGTNGHKKLPGWFFIANREKFRETKMLNATTQCIIRQKC